MTDIVSTDWFEALDISEGGIFPVHSQQTSRTAGGKVLARNFGTQLWRAEFTTTPMLLSQAMDIETDLLALDGSINWIALFDPRQPKPRLYNGSGSLTGYSYSSIYSTDNYVVNFVVGDTAFHKGDYFSYTHNDSQYLHRIVEMITSTRARVYPAMSQNAPSSAEIVVDKPWARFQIDPATVNSQLISVDGFTKAAVVGFRGIQTIT